MRVLGIDTSLTSTGVAIIDGAAIVTARTVRIESAPPKRAKGDKTPVPIEQRRRRIADIVDTAYTWTAGRHTALTIIEGPSYASAGASTWDRAWLWGAMVDRMLANDIPVVVVPPKTRALWATGSGASSKAPIAVHLSRMWPDVDPGISDDEWDALALASMGAQHLGWLPVELVRHREQLAKVTWPDIPAGAAA